MKNFTE